MPSSWLDLFGAALSGGAVVKVADYFFSEFQRRSEESRSVRKLVSKHLDPILKAADELVGKIASLAREDFRELQRPNRSKVRTVQHQIILTNILFLIAQFWARIQLLRLESLAVDLARETTGRRITQFLAALEARRNRLVDRAWQRGIGESLLTYRGDKADLLTYYEFVELYAKNQNFQAWFEPLATLLQQVSHTRYRQRLLVYGAILHAFIDTLDPKHVIVRKTPAWPNKLSRRSSRELEYRVFKVYLPFVKERRKYCRVILTPQKKGARGALASTVRG